MEHAPSTQLVEELLAQRAWLQGLARRLAGAGGSDDLADDLAQETWVAALEGSPEGRGSIRPWLAGVMRHLAGGGRRAGARRRERERRSARAEALPATDELVERVDLEQRLTRALLALEEPYRTTLLLRFHEGLSSAEIARRQGVPEGTVRWRCKTGIDELRERLTRELGGRDALGLALVGLIGRTGSASRNAGPGAAASTAAGATTMIGTEGIAAGIVAAAAALSTWWGIAGRTEPPAAGARSGQGTVVRAPAIPAAGAGAGSSRLAEPVSQGSNQRSLAGPPLTRIRILESDGRPNAELDAAVEAAPGEAHGLADTTDADGWVGFPASGERRRIAVQRVNTFPFRTELELVPGESTLQLPSPGEGELAGVVLVDGRPPSETMWLTLHAASSAAIGLEVTGPSTLLTADFAYVSTDAEGRFCFQGLAPGQGVNLRFPEGHARQGMRAYSDPDEGAVYHFEGPAEDLRLELERWPSLRGRVVEADGVTPVESAYVEIRSPDGLSGRWTGPDGTFGIFLREPPVRVSVKSERKKGWHELHGASPEGTTAEFAFDERRDDTDLGDLLLTPSPGFFLEVRDGAGNLLAGAEAGECAGQPTNATDATGRTWISGLAPGTELAITMRGHRTAFVTLPDPLPETLPVVLTPANDLTLELRGADGQPLAGVLLELSAPVWFFPRGEPTSEAWRQSFFSHGNLGAWWMSWARNRAFEGRRGNISGGPPVRVQFTADANGRCSVGELDPSVALHLTVLDDVGFVLHEQELAPLALEERRVVQVAVSTPVSAVRGRVVSEPGEPIPWAEASLGFPGADASSRTSQADGRFQFTRVADHELVLTVKKQGYQQVVRERVRPSAEELELVLPPGHEVTVLVRNASGSPHGGGVVRVRNAGEPRWHESPWTIADERAPGVFVLAGLPSEPREILVELPAGLLQQTWTPPQREVVFWVPDGVGTVELVLPAPATFPANLRAWVEPRGGGPRRDLAFDPTRGELRFEQFAGDYDLVFEQSMGTVGGMNLTRPGPRRPFTVVAGETVRIQFP